MPFNVDVAIIGTFLIITLITGLSYGRKLTNISQFALGERDFSTGTLAATISATWIGGSVLSQTISETYSQGLYFIIPVIGDSLVLMVLGVFLVPRMYKFLGANLSIAHTMGEIYGPIVRFITAIISLLVCVGAIAGQFKVSASILSLTLGVSSFNGVLCTAAIVLLYSSFGGIKSVTFTDIIQLATFSAIIPIISLIIWGTFENTDEVFGAIAQMPLLNFNNIFQSHNARLLDSFLLFLFFIIPTIEPTTFQRILMARDIRQAQKSCVIASLICLAISLVTVWVGILLLYENPNLDPNTLLSYIIDQHAYQGLKGIISIGVLAIIMSTADSYMNTSSVIFTNDLFGSLNIKFSERTGLIISRISSLLIGVGAFFMAFKTKSFLELTYLVWGSYMPIITTPLILALIGFRTSQKVALLGILGGFTTILTFEMLNFSTKSVIPAMGVNTFIMFFSHWLLHGKFKFDKMTEEKPTYHHDTNLITFNQRLKNIFLKNTPQDEVSFVYMGIFCLVAVFSSMYSIPAYVRDANPILLKFIYHSVPIIATIFLTFPLWPNKKSFSFLMPIIWVLGVFYCTVFVGSILVLINSFGQFQMMIFLLNVYVVTHIFRWKLALFIVSLGILSSLLLGSHLDITYHSEGIGNLQIKLMYILLLLSGILFAFFKPQQEYLAATEEKAEILGKKSNHLSARVEHQEQEIKRLSRVSDVILNNVNHELRLPITGVINFSEMIDEQAQKLGDEYIQMLSRDLNKSSLRLSTMMLSMLDLATFNARKIKLKKEKFDISQMVRERIELCKKIYLEDKPIDFKLHLQSYLPIVGDKNYLMQVIDNLITNSINYSDGGIIDIRLYFRVDDMIEFAVIDEGKGISDDELESVFRPFKVGSRTSSPAGGRGLGLSLCKAVIESHGGSIRAFSRNKGAHISFLLPS